MKGFEEREIRMWVEENKSEKEKKGIEAQKVKPLTQTRVIDALIGDEKQNESRNKSKKKETGSGPQSSDPGTFGRLLRPTGIIE